MLRVALVTRRFWPLVGGTERVMANLAEELPQLGVKPIVLTAQWDSHWPVEIDHVVDSRPRFHSRHPMVDRARRVVRRSESRLAISIAQCAVHGRAAFSLGSRRRIASGEVDAGNRHLPHALRPMPLAEMDGLD